MKYSIAPLSAALLISLVACAHTPKAPPQNVKEVVISLHDISCQSCGATSVKALKQVAGVIDATFDRDRVELLLSFDKTRTQPEKLLAVVEALGYAGKLGAGSGRYVAQVVFPPEVDAAWVSKEGEAVDIEQHKVAGKVTVFDFYADWCGPCREVDRAMLSVLKDNDDVALRKLNVVDWESGVAKQYLAKIPSLPYVIIYSPSGKRVQAIHGLHLDELFAAIDKARGI